MIVMFLFLYIFKSHWVDAGFPTSWNTAIIILVPKERLKRSYQASDFLTDIEISPSRFELKKNQF